MKIAEQNKLLQQIAEIRRRAEAATKGPWDDWDFDGAESENERMTGLWITVGPFPGDVICTFGVNPSQQDYANAKFAAAARTDVPALCDMMERLLREREVLAQAVAARAAWKEHLINCTRCDCDADYGIQCHDGNKLMEACVDAEDAALALLRDGMPDMTAYDRGQKTYDRGS